MNILITGHTGFIGSHTAEYFLENGHTVYGVSRSMKDKCKHNQYALDVTDCEHLSRLVNEKCIDRIVHFAGKPLVADCDKDPFNAFNANGLGTASVLEAARFADVERTLVIETDKVYGFQEIIPTKEDAIPNPKSPYEFSKVLASLFCDFYRDHYQMDVISVRPVNVFGPGDFSFTRIIPASMRNIAEGKGIPVYEPGDKVFRDFIYVKDVAKMIYILVNQDPLHNTYNLSNNDPMSILGLAQTITRILSHPIEPLFVQKPGNYAEIPYQAIDGTRFKAEFDYESVPFETAILETYEAYLEKFNLSILGR